MAALGNNTTFYDQGRVPTNWCFQTVVLEKILESPLDCKEIQPVHPKGDQSFIGRTDVEAETRILATWCEELTRCKRPWCWEWLRAGGEGDKRGRDGWMASSTQWIWIRASSGRRWRTGKPGVLLFKGSQTAGREWAIKNNKVSNDHLPMLAGINFRLVEEC